MLKHLVETKSDDDTALGNLIFMFEPAHFDVYSLWHWLLYYLAKNNHVADRIAEALAADRVAADKLVRATILETLRLNQSEVLYRQAADDIVFDGQFMPKGEVVRVCLWEGHKDEGTFTDPFAFRPERFLEQDFGLDQFAPFGLDKRRCIGADLTMALTSIFVAELCRRFSCTPDRGRAAHVRRIPLGAGRRQPDFVVVARLKRGYRLVAEPLPAPSRRVNASFRRCRDPLGK